MEPGRSSSIETHLLLPCRGGAALAPLLLLLALKYPPGLPYLSLKRGCKIPPISPIITPGCCRPRHIFPEAALAFLLPGCCAGRECAPGMEGTQRAWETWVAQTPCHGDLCALSLCISERHNCLLAINLLPSPAALPCPSLHIHSPAPCKTGAPQHSLSERSRGSSPCTGSLSCHCTPTIKIVLYIHVFTANALL